MNDTIFAVSSGAPPAAIAVLRVSGAEARSVGTTLCGDLPEPRRAALRRVRAPDGRTLDRALLLWFPGPRTATGEDLLELHLHGGRAVVAVVEEVIAGFAGTRRAEPGEFTRRALINGRIDLTQATGLADLLEAETETQRRAAITTTEGAFGRDLRIWLKRLSDVRALLEAAIDYDDEDDLRSAPLALADELASLRADLACHLSAPTAERVGEGLRIVIAGPPNAGKSSLFNALLSDDVAIVSSVAGTTRDRIETRVTRSGQFYTLVDTAGLSEWTDDPIEREGIRRSRLAISGADLVLWVADEPPPEELPSWLWVRSRADLPGRSATGEWDVIVSVRDRSTIDMLWLRIEHVVSGLLRTDETYLLRRSQRDVLTEAAHEVAAAVEAADLLIAADHLRRAGVKLGALLGHDHVESMLDSLFSRFCIGK